MPSLDDLVERAIARTPEWGRPAVTLALRTLTDTRNDRVPGLAAEVAFFVLLSLPPLLLLVLGAVGYLGQAAPSIATDAADRLLSLAGTVLTGDTVALLEPVIEQLLTDGRADIASLGVVLTVYSASRALRVIVVALTIAYDQPEIRPSWKDRLWGIGLTVIGLVLGVVAVPLLVLGPGFGHQLGSRVIAGSAVDFVWRVGYWPTAVVVATLLIASLYHFAAPWTTPWRRDLPGAVLAMVLWLAGSAGLRVYVARSLVAEAVFTPLAGPLVLLLWLYVSAFAVLLGAELNAEIEKLWPTRGEPSPDGADVGDQGGRRMTDGGRVDGGGAGIGDRARDGTDAPPAR